jgi:hypothetical protein
MNTEESEWRNKYNAVINSFRWRGLKMRLLAERGRKCQSCKKPCWPLELHHTTYERLGEELDADLLLLCARCHAAADEERAADGRHRAASALEAARYHGWVTAVYGEDCYVDETTWDAYQYWRERKDSEY